MNQITEKEREFIENKLKMTTRTIVVSRTKQEITKSSMPMKHLREFHRFALFFYNGFA